MPQIPEEEIEISFSRSSGPGGQHVNKSSTKALAIWNVSSSTAFTPEQKERIIAKHGSEILQASNQETRSQLENRKRAIQKLNKMVQQALEVEKDRIPTQATFASRIKRLFKKKIHSEIKKLRKKPDIDEFAD